MIPTIETIIADLLAGTLDRGQAVNWLNMHAEGSANDLRDHFAGLAMQGLLASPRPPVPGSITGEVISDHAYKVADSMLAERAK
jgi:hypothetical protein